MSATPKPWEERHGTRHPRWEEYLELERRERAIFDEWKAVHERHGAAVAAKHALQDLIYGDSKRLVYRCDLCGAEPPLWPGRKRMRDVGGWMTWTLDDESGDMACRCPACVGEGDEA